MAPLTLSSSRQSPRCWWRAAATRRQAGWRMNQTGCLRRWPFRCCASPPPTRSAPRHAPAPPDACSLFLFRVLRCAATQHHKHWRFIMATYVKIAAVEDLPADGMRSFAYQDRRIALYRIGETIYATDAICSHEDADLTEGWLDP